MPTRDAPRIPMGAATGIPTRGPIPLPHWRPITPPARGPQHVARTVLGVFRPPTETELYDATARLVGPITVQHVPRHAVAAGVVGPVRVMGGMGDSFPGNSAAELLLINGSMMLVQTRATG